MSPEGCYAPLELGDSVRRKTINISPLWDDQSTRQLTIPPILILNEPTF